MKRSFVTQAKALTCDLGAYRGPPIDFRCGNSIEARQFRAIAALYPKTHTQRIAIQDVISAANFVASESSFGTLMDCAKISLYNALTAGQGEQYPVLAVDIQPPRN